MAWCHIPEGLNPQHRCCENLRYCLICTLHQHFWSSLVMQPAVSEWNCTCTFAVLFLFLRQTAQCCALQKQEDTCCIYFTHRRCCTVLCITETRRYLLYIFHAQKVLHNVVHYRNKKIPAVYIPRTEGAAQIKVITIFRCTWLLTFYAMCVWLHPQMYI
jgi:hypothetical protein